MEKLFIKNRKDQKISLIIDKPENQVGLVFVMHGLGGFKEQLTIELFTKTFMENGYVAIRFDTTNTFGESDGNYEDATITNYFEDLEDVIEWAKKQDWYQEPFCLAGHSLGGICTALYAEKYPERVKALAPIATVVSGELSMNNKLNKGQDIEEWKRTGWQIIPSSSIPGVMKKLKWSHMEDRLKYDLLPNVSELTMPVLLLVGELDTSTPIKHQELLFEKLPGKKEIHIIAGAPHTFKELKHLEEIGKILDKWIKTI